MAIGMGLVALDVVFSADANSRPRWYAGGTCANVLTALSYMGWRAVPISRLGNDKASSYLVADLARWKVATEFITRTVDGSTPIIVERIRRSANGSPEHSFSWRCPSCGSFLPGYKPVLATAVEKLALAAPRASVFFFDRVSRSTLLMAQIYKKRGALIVFEPASVGDPALFREAWAIAHIVKYSHERLREIADIDLPKSRRESVLLEIETLGPDGLRFRSRINGSKTDGWTSLRAFAIQQLSDTAGAGDWCTAGVLDVLARNGNLESASTTDLARAMNYGQALAAWNCSFEGARGGMYAMPHKAFTAAVDKILQGSSRELRSKQQDEGKGDDALREICRSCGEIPEIGATVAKGVS